MDSSRGGRVLGGRLGGLLRLGLVFEGDWRLLSIKGVHIDQKYLKVESLRWAPLSDSPLLLIGEVKYVVWANIVDELAHHWINWLIQYRPWRSSREIRLQYKFEPDHFTIFKQLNPNYTRKYEISNLRFPLMIKLLLTTPNSSIVY